MSNISARAIKQLIFLIALIVRLILFNHTLIAVLIHIFLVTFFSQCSMQVDVIGPLLLNASLLLVLTTDYSDWLVQVTQLIDS